MTDSKFRALIASGVIAGAAAMGAAFQPTKPESKPATQPESKQPAQPGRGPGGERGPGEGRGPGGPGAEGRRESVEGSMKLINRSLRQLKDQIGDAGKKDENLKLINDAERGVVAAKGQALPAGLLKKAADDAAKAKLSDSFRRDLVSLLRSMLDLETSVADGKTEEAKKQLGELIKMRDKAHEELGVKDE